MIKSKQLGMTLVELLIVIAIMGILSLTFYFYTRPNLKKQVELSTEELLGNLRQVRSLAVNKATHKFANTSEAVFPPGGYGIVFDNTADQAKYFVYADKSFHSGGFQESQGDEIIGSVIYLPVPNNDTDEAFQISNSVNDDDYFYFSILGEKDVDTDMPYDSPENKRYVLRLRWPGTSTVHGYEAKIRLGEQTSDGSIIPNFGAAYAEYIKPRDGDGDREGEGGRDVLEP
ncbi:MAG: hypothetical protein C3F02_03400 [Parcubacteria group bacterium]|nr:MAG: hypothetical protein C3F02_03400 [Parcubacteria group bacterium]